MSNDTKPTSTALARLVADSLHISTRENDAQATQTEEDPAVLRIPLEIWTDICTHLHLESIARLGRVHSTLYTMITPILYHTFETHIMIPTTAVTSSNREYETRPERLLSQYRFVRSILAHPELAAHVKCLYWEMGLNKTCKMPAATAGGKARIWDDQALFRLFSQLTNVLKVDIVEGVIGTTPLTREMIGKSFFPLANSIRLEGHFRKDLAEAILHKEVGALVEGKNKEHSDVSHTTTTVKSLTLDRFMEVENGTGELTKMTYEDLCRYSKCRNVTLLSIKLYDWDLPKALVDRRGAHIDKRWANWARFMQTVQPKSLRFDCDLGLAGKPGANREVAACENRFEAILLPVLLKEWAGLESIEILGIRSHLLQQLKQKKTVSSKR